ncbi:GLE1-like protein-domain-containing protein [Flammula alnicola]|nr:GLE1-like protein-domain-containing protein [Flammula alnicola]
MRFSAPRSVSPSPVRGKLRKSSTFGLQSDSDSEDYDSELDSSFNSDTDDDAISIASASSSSSSSFSLVSDINKLSLRPRHIARTPLEQREIEDTVSAIRLRTRYHDPYEEWEKQTRKDAFKTARKDLLTTQTHLYEEQERIHTDEEKQRAAQSAQCVAEVHDHLNAFRKQIQETESKLKESWKIRDKQLWDRIEAVIKLEEDKLAKRLEEERKVKAEEERKRNEAELKRRLAEEKRLQEEAEKKRAEEEEKRLQEEKEQQEKEEEEKQKKMEEERNKRLEEEAELRMMLKSSPPDDDWRVARTNLQNLKSGPMHYVKETKELKAEWGRLRRQIIPKVGQLTNDPQAISRISQQLVEIAKPSNGPPLESSIYIALCSSLAKAILLQAETEVTAEKRSAGPLAQVAFTLLDTLEYFPSIFYAKLVQRCGGWPIPFVVPGHDVDEIPWNSRDDRVKASGVRRSTSGDGLESTEEYSNRVSAVMRVYFHILKIRPMNKPLDPLFQLPRCWTWFARMTGDTRLLRDPSLLSFSGLEVLGLEAVNVWGQQWIKMLALIHEGITTGYEKDKLIGGDSAEGAAARTRVMVALENIMNGVQS